MSHEYDRITAGKRLIWYKMKVLHAFKCKCAVSSTNSIKKKKNNSRKWISNEQIQIGVALVVFNLWQTPGAGQYSGNKVSTYALHSPWNSHTQKKIHLKPIKVWKTKKKGKGDKYNVKFNHRIPRNRLNLI